MASTRASRWPPPLMLLLLPLLLLLLPPAAPGTRGQPSSPARSAPNGTLLSSTGLVRPPEPGPERELQPPPPWERRGPASPDPSQTSPGPDATTPRGPFDRAPRGGTAAAVRNHWPENSTEPHIENITFYQDQVSLSALAAKEGVMIQTPRKSHASSDAPEDLSPLTGTADVRGRNDSLSGTNFTISPIRHSPEIATELTSQSNTSALEGLHLSSSSSESEEGLAPSHRENGTSWGLSVRAEGLPEEVTVHTQVAATSFPPQSPLPALAMGEQTTLSRERDSSEPGLSSLHFSRTPTYSPPSDHPSPYESMKEPNNSTDLSSPSISQTQDGHVASTFTDGGPRMRHTLPVSVGPRNETSSFPGDSENATTSALVHSSPSIKGLKRNSRIIENPGDEEFTEPSTENGFELTSSEISMRFWQNDSPTFGGHQLANSSDTENGSSTSQIEAVSGSSTSIRGGESTAHWSLINSKTFAGVTGNSTSFPEVVNSSVLTHSPYSAHQPERSSTVLGDRHYSEPSTAWLSTSSLESLDPSVPRAIQDSLELGGSPDTLEKTSGSHSHSPHTWATFTGNGERTLRSLSSGNTTSGEVGGSASVLREAANATQHADVTDDSDLVPGWQAALRDLGVTGISYGQGSGTAVEQRTSSDRTDHTYVSSTFTKGERTLLSITDNSSSSDIRESSTSYIKISNSSHLEYSSFPHAQTEKSNISSYDGEYAQSSTAALAMRTSNLQPHTSTVSVPNTLVLLDADAGSVGGSSSSSGPPLALPSVSQSYQLLSSTSPSTVAHLVKSTSDASLSSSSSHLPVSSTATPAPLSISQTTLTHPSSTPVLPGAREIPVTSVRTLTMASSAKVLYSSQTVVPENQEKVITESKSPTLLPHPAGTTGAVTMSSPSRVHLPLELTESSNKQTLPTMSTLAHVPPMLTATAPENSPPPMTTASLLLSTTALTRGATAVQTTARKQILPTSPEILVRQISTEGAVTTDGSQVHIDVTTRLIPPAHVPTSTRDTATGPGITEQYSPASHFLRASPFPQTTDVSTHDVLTPKSTASTAQSSTQSPVALSSPTSVRSCATNPCLHDGECVVDSARPGYRCLCSPSWQGDDCSVDVNECLSNPCPPLATCNNTQGSFICKCPVGYQLEKGICSLVRTFVTELKLKKAFPNITVETHSDLHEVENEITKTLNVCFSTSPGYARSTVQASREPSTIAISLQTTFSLASNVTLFDLADRMQRCVNSCRSSAEVCQLLGSQRRIFRAGSLCKRKSPECDRETSICTDLDGIALCQCKSGYFQFNKMDHSCRACEDGYRLENETCMSCPFGLGGLNCGNPYQLITVVIAAAGGGLLLILGIALIVTCCRKNKNDISKLIFKSGDFQMSPYAEYPKNPRSQDWGREAIEMHENGSTKNLLQMTDVYYSPTGVRNPELERNGLYPAYTGLPGSRHSCIFPGQYNPSFISDESRRRDYF
ncbi:protein HEG homolog 1 [Tamandua tetradactyla]|uniref:protein HEG homolog 1 n=1 Tax=Tamandua tetradactyla TaxID=48850 RepID=UPI00405407AB